MSDIPSWAVRGAKVVCIKTDEWINEFGEPTSARPPRFGEVVTIEQVTNSQEFGGWWIGLVERPTGALFALDCFAPLVDDSVEAELFRRRHFGADAPLVLS